MAHLADLTEQQKNDLIHDKVLGKHLCAGNIVNNRCTLCEADTSAPWFDDEHVKNYCGVWVAAQEIVAALANQEERTRYRFVETLSNIVAGQSCVCDDWQHPGIGMRVLARLTPLKIVDAALIARGLAEE